MGETTKGLFIFAAGAAIGSAITYGLLKKKFEQFASDEIAEIREYYLNRKTEKKDEPVKDEDKIKDEYKEKVKDYTSCSEKIDDKTVDDKPYIIEPEELGEISEYEIINLTYTSDGYLLDDNDELIDDPDEVVGLDNLKEIGKYEDDALHVRNDSRKVDYEILKVLDTYGGGK